MVQGPLVSVLVPAYNHEQYVEEALQSVVNQTYRNIELIVINDGSADGTGRVIERFIRQNPDFPILYLEQANAGICRTLNKGLGRAKGKYVALLASDDLWISEKIEKQIYLMERNENIGMIFSDHYFMRYCDRTEIKATDYKPNIRKYFKKNIQNTNLYEKLMTEDIIPALTVLFRRDCIDSIGEFDPKLEAEDYDMWLRIAKEFPIAFIDEPLAYYRTHDRNLSNKSGSIRGIKTILKIMKKQYREKPFKHHYFKISLMVLKLGYTLTINRIKKAFFIERKYRRI